MDFKNYMCPVCEKAFQDEDDVVVCPDCGTPHHRECWKKNDECFNKEKHGTDIEKLIVPHIEEENPSHEAVSEKQEFQRENSEDIKKEAEVIFDQVEGQSWENNTIKGESFKDYATAIGKNERYYLLRFKMMEKRDAAGVWNGVAFLIPLAWAFYRKMYKIAALILALYVLAVGTVSYSMFSDGEIMEANAVCMQEDVNYASKILQYASGNEGVVLSPSQTELYNKIMSIEIPLFVQILNYAVIFGVRMVMGLKATPFYFKKVTEKIKRIKGMNIPQDLKNYELRRRGGTAPFIIAAIIGFFEIQLFLM